VTGVAERREREVKLGRRLTVARGYDRHHVPADPGFKSPGFGARVSQYVARLAEFPTSTCESGLATSIVCADARDRTRGLEGASSRGEKAQESTGAAGFTLAGVGSLSERTPEGSKASKRACRLLTGEPGVVEAGGHTGARFRVCLPGPN